MFRKVDVPVLGIIENMSYFTCPALRRPAPTSSRTAGARHEAEKMETPFLARSRSTSRSARTSDAGTPIVAEDPESPHSAAYRAVAEQVWRQLNDQPLRPAPRIVIQ